MDNTHAIREQKHFDRFLQAVTRFFPASQTLYIFEMGAKDCEDTLRLHRAFPFADIYTFECNEETLPLCRKAVESIDKIHLTESAVSDVSEQISFYPIDTEKTLTAHADGNPGASSMFKASGKYADEQYTQKETRVPSVRLDDFITTHNLPGIDILWLDAQGAELKILQGLGKKLRNVRAIHTEVEFVEMYSGQPLADEIKKFLTQNGFVFAGYTTKGHHFADALFINRDLAPTFLSRVSIRSHRILSAIKKRFS